MAVAAYFSRAPFINALLEENFHVITRLRKDIVMRFLYHRPKRKGRGRPKKYAGKIDLHQDLIKSARSKIRTFGKRAA